MSQYTDQNVTIQIPMDQDFRPPVGWLAIQSGLAGFQQTAGEWNAEVGRGLVSQTIYGECVVDELDRVCEKCGCTMHIHETRASRLRHVPTGSVRTDLLIEHSRLRCPHCGHEYNIPIQFQSSYHRITLHLEHYIEDLLELGLTLKEIQQITGVHRHTVKAIDMRRLKRLYTEDGKLKKPERQAKVLGIDEFSLHDGQQYAVIIIDMETGHVLWVQHTKCKQVVYDFIEHVGSEWMSGVEAVCCDMNAGFANAFLEKCPHLAIVFDRFHVVKNFNDHVVHNVRKDEQRRLKSEGDEEGARLLKKSKYLLSSNRSTLKKRDAQAGQPVRKGSELFKVIPGTRKGGREAHYDELIAQNKLFFTIDLVKEALADAYQQTDTAAMREKIENIITVCEETENEHFEWFAKLLSNHMDGIITHAKHPCSSGKVEGTVNLIKTVRRRGYGYPDDEYLFLKVIDASHRK